MDYWWKNYLITISYHLIKSFKKYSIYRFQKVRKRPRYYDFQQALRFLLKDSPPYSSIVIIEFKRPLRDDYTDDDNPIVSSTKICKRNEKREDINSERDVPVSINENTPFYAYIICDITPKLVWLNRHAAPLFQHQMVWVIIGLITI